MEKRSYYMSKMPLLRPSMLTFVLRLGACKC